MMELGFLRRVHAIMVARTPEQWVTKPGLALIVICASDMATRRMVFGAGYPIVKSTVVTAGISLPFIAFAFLVMSQVKQLQRSMTSLAMTDMLSGLPNRRAFLDATRRAFRRSYSGYLLLLDADHFKHINDEYGHAVGDLCLQAIAEHIKTQVRDTDAVGRLGGEEFGMFLPHRSIAEVRHIANQLVRPICVDVDSDIGELVIQFTLSVGATDIHHSELVEAALERADIALYRAKEAGRARMFIEHRPRFRKRRNLTVVPQILDGPRGTAVQAMADQHSAASVGIAS